MTRDEHIARHKELHRALDELLVDFIAHASPGRLGRLSETPLMELLIWSAAQTKNPAEHPPITHPPGAGALDTSGKPPGNAGA